MTLDTAKIVNSNEKMDCDLTDNNNSCNKTIRHESFCTESKRTIFRESVFEISKPRTNKSENDCTFRFIDKHTKQENLILDFKFTSQEGMEKQENLSSKEDFNNKIDNNAIPSTEEDLDTLVIYYDGSDIDYDTSDSEEVKNKIRTSDINYNTSDSEEVKNRIRTKNNGTYYEENRKNKRDYQLQQIYMNDNACESELNIPPESSSYYITKIDGFHTWSCEDALKNQRIDQQVVSIRNAENSYETHVENSTLHVFDSKTDLKLPNHDQQHDDPDILKIFIDESDIDSDSEISTEYEEIEPDINENCTISVCEEVCDPNSETSTEYEEIEPDINENCTIFVREDAFEPNVSVSNVATSTNINIINDEAKHNISPNSELNSFHTPDITQSTVNTIPDYFDEEKTDLIDPGWNKIKSLSTDKDRYKVVSECWQSSYVPDPTKNLTYYSFRKRLLCSQEDNTIQRNPLKRQASNSLNDQDSKRVRLCTYVANERIKAIENERRVKTQNLRNAFDRKMQERFMLYQSIERSIEQRHLNFYGTIRNHKEINGAKLKQIWDQFEREIKNLECKYQTQLNDLQNECMNEINASYRARKEMMGFFNYYETSETDGGTDTTLLTREQQLIFDEIENIYRQFDVFYSSE